MRKQRISLKIYPLLFIYFSGGVWAQTHCKSPQQTAFSCVIADTKDIASLCVVDDIEPHFLQFRLGKPGRVKLVFPIRPQTNQFLYLSVRSRQVEENSIEFVAHNAKYEVVTTWLPQFNDLGEQVREESEQVVSGISISKNSSVNHLRCSSSKPLEAAILFNVKNMAER